MVVEGATHCHMYIPLASQCGGPRVDVGHMAGARGLRFTNDSFMVQGEELYVFWLKATDFRTEIYSLGIGVSSSRVES